MCITDKNDTFHLNGQSYGTFRLLARAVKRDLAGNAIVLDNITPAVSSKFIVSAGGAVLGLMSALVKGVHDAWLIRSSCRRPQLLVQYLSARVHMVFVNSAQVTSYALHICLSYVSPDASKACWGTLVHCMQVKTQRALNDYRKCEYPHYKDELTKLKYIGTITAQRLRDIQAHLGDVPFQSIETGEAGGGGCREWGASFKQGSGGMLGQDSG